MLACSLASGQSITNETAAPSRHKRVLSATLQAGFSETFQLTLGGMFGGGPARQNNVAANPGTATP